MSEPVTKTADQMLQDSPFATISDCEQFLNWYRKQPHHTAWDETRHDIATSILIQADIEGHPDY